MSSRSQLDQTRWGSCRRRLSSCFETFIHVLRSCATNCSNCCSTSNCCSIKMAPPAPKAFRSPKFWQSFVGESLGTLLFVLLGCGSWIETDPQTEPSSLRVAITMGFTYAVLVYAFRYISGGHFNPVVSMAAAATRKISVFRAILYAIAQCIGAIVGAALLLGFTPHAHRGTLGATIPAEGVTQNQAFAIEFFSTFVFLFVLTACRDQVEGEDNPPYAQPFVIGLALLVTELYSIPYTGGGMNPARSLGTSIVINNWHFHWVYWFGPALGGLAGALVYDLVFASNASMLRVRGCMMANDAANRKPVSKSPSIGKPTQQTDLEQVALQVHSSSTPSICECENEQEVNIEGSNPSLVEPKYPV